MKALLFAAGLGTRLKPFTDHHPKALASVNGKTLLELNLRYLQKFGIEEVIVNVHHFADQIEHVIQENNGFGSRVSISDERGEVLETGGGLKKAGWFFEGERDFIAMNVDALTDLDLGAMVARHQSGENMATLAVMDRRSSRYLLFNEDMRLRAWETKDAASGEPKTLYVGDEGETLQKRAFSGVQVISTAIFQEMKDGRFCQAETGVKFSTIPLYMDLAASHRIIGFDHSGGRFLDVGKPESLKMAETLFNN